MNKQAIRIRSVATALALFVAVFVSTSTFIAAIAHAQQVTGQIPSDALVVMRVKSLQGLSDKVSALAKQWGVAEMSAALSDPLGAFREQAHLQNGLNADADAAFVYVDAGEGGDEEKSFLALLPVSDYTAFLGNFADVKTEGEVSTFTMPEEPDEPGYIAHWGQYAAISPIRALVEKQPEQTMTATGLAAKELQDKDFVVYANFAKLGPKLQPKLQQARADAMAEMEKELNQQADAQKAAPVARAMVDQAFNAAQRFLTETQAATFGINLDEQGIQSTTLAEFQPDSYLGQTAQSLKNTDATLVEGLPDQKYLFLGGYQADPQVVAHMIDELIGPVVKELQGDEMKAVADYVESARQFMSALKGQSYGLVAPRAALGTESLFQVVSVAQGDSKTLMSAYQKCFRSQGELIKSLISMAPAASAPAADDKDENDIDNPDDADDNADADVDDDNDNDADDNAANATPDQPPVELTYSPAAMTVAGVVFDQFKTEFHINPSTPQEAQAAQVLTLIYGPEGLNGYIGAVDDQHVLFITGGNEASMEQAVQAVKANSTKVAQAQSIQSVAQQLPQNRLAVLYVPLGQWVETGVTYAQQFGLAVPFQVPQDLPPVGMTLATDQSAVRIDGYVPSTLVENLVKIGMQMFMGMQQGQPGAPEGM